MNYLSVFKCTPIAKAIAHNVHRNYMVGNIIREKGFIYQIQKLDPRTHFSFTHAFKFHSLKEATELMFHTEHEHLCFTQNVNTKHYLIISNRLTQIQIRPVIERISGDKKIIKMAHNPASAV